MARGRAWTADEDAAIREAERRTAEFGQWGHLRDCAARIGRSYPAVRKRAERLGVTRERRAAFAGPEAPNPTPCRICGGPVPPGRRTLCSYDCQALAEHRCPGCYRKLSVSVGAMQCTDSFCGRYGETWPAP